jgi:hypothetical protein
LVPFVEKPQLCSSSDGRAQYPVGDYLEFLRLLMSGAVQSRGGK